MATSLLDPIVQDKEYLQKFVDRLLRVSLDSEDCKLFYKDLRAVYGNCLFFKLRYLKLLKEERVKEEEKFSSTTERLIIKGYTQHEREVMRNIASSEDVKLMKDLLEYIEVVMDGCKSLERSVYGLMQASQLDIKISGMAH